MSLGLERIEDKVLNSEGLPQTRVPDYRETLSEREENRRLRFAILEVRATLDRLRLLIDKVLV